MSKTGEIKPHNRDGIWYLVRRVPKEYAALDRRGLVRVSSNVTARDDPRGIRATLVVKQLNLELEAYWRGMRDGQSAEAQIRYAAAQKRARSIGVTYKTALELSEGPLDEILKRVNLLINRDAVESETDVAAALGGEERPSIMLADLVVEYEKLQGAALSQMSEAQVRKWRNPKLRALKNLISVIGNKSITALTRDDALLFRMWWQGRLIDEGLDVGTANKDIGHISKMLRTLDTAYMLDLKPIFQRLRFEGEEDRQRAAFEADYVQRSLLDNNPLKGLNDQAKALFNIVADSGLRPSEAANLLPENIQLDHPVPHVQIRPIGRTLKTKHSQRDIPLVGVALVAMKKYPNGFSRYRDKADSLSAIVNKMLNARKLLPTDDHSFYSLRHTFEDRLTAVEAPEKVVAMLMGHKWHRPKYGAGPSLKQRQHWMNKIAFK